MVNKQRKLSVFKKIEENFVLQLILFVVLSFIIILGYVVVDNMIDERLHREYTIINDMKLVNDVENITTGSGKTVIEGYAFISDRHSSDDLISVFLRNYITEDEVWFDMEQIDRPDINAYFEGEYNYENAGFVASTDSKALDANACYEIIINIDYDKIDEDGSKNVRKTVSTNRFLLNSEIYTYNPIEFYKPDMDIESKLLREVFSNGKLCLYQKEEGMYVYQYEGKLYWIVNENINLEENGDIYIIYQPYTSQIEKLPEHRMQYKYDNLDFSFEDREYRDEISDPYRVAIRDIPDQYPITYIRTGVYDTVNKKTLWHEQFQIDHNFN